MSFLLRFSKLCPCVGKGKVVKAREQLAALDDILVAGFFAEAT
jgi:hypothetical protein